MKKDTSNKMRLGIFISVGIVIFTAAIYFIGERQQLFRSTFRLSGVFKDVAGLQIGNNVRLSGINVGTVDNITIISDTTVKVEILIDEKARKFIKKDAIASIGSEGLMGNKALVISPGTGDKKRIEDNDVMKTSPPLSMDDILLTVKTSMENTSSITNDLAVITKNIQEGKGTIGRLIMDKSWMEDFEITFTNLKRGSTEFRILMEKANDIDDVLLSIKETIKNTSNITSDLAKITATLESGQGTIGRLLMDESTAQNIDSTFINLKEGASGLKILMEKAKSSWLLWGF
ncbi:MAG: MCE family protein [Ignavibacteria bacterium]|nr:MCE family protein [Ignavibacteria bacterium]